MLVIIVESMGVPNSTVLKTRMEEKLFTSKVKARWATTSLNEPFSGSTTSGEIRVLCGLTGQYHRLTVDNASQCLPNKIALAGYTTTGMHGFTSQMFDRATWWPTIGINNRFFAEQLSNSGNFCGHAFPGICDKDLIIRAVNIAGQPKQFVYLLTLNSHLTLLPTEIPLYLQVLCKQESAGTQACQLIAQLGNVL
jgi:hypothetical protein